MRSKFDIVLALNVARAQSVSHENKLDRHAKRHYCSLNLYYRAQKGREAKAMTKKTDNASKKNGKAQVELKLTECKFCLRLYPQTSLIKKGRLMGFCYNCGVWNQKMFHWDL